jgi:hypothetical protein
VADFNAQEPGLVWDAELAVPIPEQLWAVTPVQQVFVVKGVNGLVSVGLFVQMVQSSNRPLLQELVDSASDGVPPTVTLVSPGAGTIIVKEDAVVFRVTDDAGLRRVMVVADHSSGQFEVIHDGDQFCRGYAGSTRTAISHGYEYTCQRDRGWPGTGLAIRIYPIDTSGNES